MLKIIVVHTCKETPDPAPSPTIIIDDKIFLVFHEFNVDNEFIYKVHNDKILFYVRISPCSPTPLINKYPTLNPINIESMLHEIMNSTDTPISFIRIGIPEDVISIVATP